MNQGQQNGIAELDSTGRVPATQTQKTEDQETALTLGHFLLSDGAGNWVSQEFSTVNEYEEDDTGATTGLNAFQDYLTHVTASLPAGNYDISWHYVYSHSVTNAYCEVIVRLIAPGATVGGLNEPGVIGHMAHEMSDTANNIEASGFKRVALNAGVHYIQIAFSTSAGGNAAIRRGALRIVKVPA